MNIALSQPAYAVRLDEHLWIPARDGTRLSATIYRPDENGHYPVIFRCDGYRKDRTRKGVLRQMGYWYAARGYAFVLMDIRGTGNSEGVAQDEYTPQELNDAYDAIEWLAAQPWSSGAVGMWGKSYSGFNSIQTAMLRPPHLKAILPIYATDDRYTDDVHYWGGCRLVGETIPYPIKMLYTNPLPPDPTLLPDRWESLWQQRVNETPPWFLEWWRQQKDGPYWRHGSLRPNYEAIDVPVFMIGGWRDGYTSSIPRMLKNLTVPCKAIIGPWGHQLPHIATLGPQLDFFNLMLRWWDHWLKDLDTGMMDEPPILYFLQDYHPPGPTKGMEGEWRTLQEWPNAGDSDASFYLGAAQKLLDGPPAVSSEEVLPWTMKLGMGEWKWCLHNPNTLSHDQRAAEPYSLVYTSALLDEPLDMLGRPSLTLTISATQEIAQLFARLCDVAPNGESTLVSWGALNLTHRDSHSDPSPLEPGVPYQVTVQFNDVSWRFRPGHRLRLILSSHDWPRLWPAPYPFDLTIHHRPEQPAVLQLPLAPTPAQIITDLDPPITVEQTINVNSKVIPFHWQIIQEQPGGRLRFKLTNSEEVEMEDGTFAESTNRWMEITMPEDDPAKNILRAYGETSLHWPDLTATVMADLLVAGTPTTFEFDLTIEVYNNGDLFSQRQWRESIPRQLM